MPCAVSRRSGSTASACPALDPRVNASVGAGGTLPRMAATTRAERIATPRAEPEVAEPAAADRHVDLHQLRHVHPPLPAAVRGHLQPRDRRDHHPGALLGLRQVPRSRAPWTASTLTRTGSPRPTTGGRSKPMTTRTPDPTTTASGAAGVRAVVVTRAAAPTARWCSTGSPAARCRCGRWRRRWPTPGSPSSSRGSRVTARPLPTSPSPPGTTGWPRPSARWRRCGPACPTAASSSRGCRWAARSPSPSPRPTRTSPGSS